MDDEKRTIKGEFTSYSREREYRAEPAEERGAMRGTYGKLLRNAVVAAVLMAGIWGISNIEGMPDAAADAAESAEAAEEVTSSELSQDEDLGKLKFVNGGFSLPVDGEVVATFSESEKNVSIEGGEQARVNSILSGTVVATDDNSVTINNLNGTRTTYTGLVPSVQAGDSVESAAQIGQLEESVLVVETVSSIGYVDPLSAEEMSAFEQ